MDDAKVFKVLDLEDIEKTFSAYQRQQVLHLLLFISSSHQLSPSSAGEGWGVDLVDLACIFGFRLGLCSEFQRISPILQLLISQAQLEKGEGRGHIFLFIYLFFQKHCKNDPEMRKKAEGRNCRIHFGVDFI